MRTFKSLVAKFSKESLTLGDFLKLLTKMEEGILRDCAHKGAVWVQKGKGKGKILRERSLKTLVTPQDTVSLFFDQKVLALPELTEATCLFENENYGVWIKEMGVVPQGTLAGDHGSLLRFIERKKRRDIFLIHRLDRETKGLMLFGYNAKAAKFLGDLFQKNLIQKEYQAVVLGELPAGLKKTIDVSLDDKKAVTHLEVLKSSGTRSLLRIHIDTGRLHQIRRHLDHIGHPVMGDPKYGKGNKNREGLKLLAKSLTFKDPFNQSLQSFSIDEDLSL